VINLFVEAHMNKPAAANWASLCSERNVHRKHENLQDFWEHTEPRLCDGGRLLFENRVKISSIL